MDSVSSVTFSKFAISFWKVGRFVRQRFWLRGAWKVFRTCDEYFKAELDEDNRKGLITHCTPLTGFADAERVAMENLVKGEPVLLFHAPPGKGKSRFAIALARRLERHNTLWDCFFVEPDIDRVTDAMSNLKRFRRCVLFVDDAHKCPDLVGRLAKAARESEGRNSLHIVCLCRSTLVHTVIPSIGFRFTQTALPRLEKSQISTIVDSILPTASSDMKRRIATYSEPSPFVAVAISVAIKRNQSLVDATDAVALRSLICRTPISEIIGVDYLYENAVSALAVFAACAPVSTDDKRIFTCAATISGISASKIETLIERVVDGGLFERYGRNKVRPSPDLVGDLILDEACVRQDGKSTGVAEKIQSNAPLEYSVAIINNIADIGSLSKDKHAPDFVGKTIEGKIRALSSDG